MERFFKMYLQTYSIFFRPVHVFIIVSCPYVAYLLKSTFQEDASSNAAVAIVQQVTNLPNIFT